MVASAGLWPLSSPLAGEKRPLILPSGRFLVLRSIICKRFCVWFGGLVGCGHMFVPFVRRIMAAGPDGVRGSDP